MLSFFPRGVLDEILNLIESVSEGFASYTLSNFLSFQWSLKPITKELKQTRNAFFATNFEVLLYLFQFSLSYHNRIDSKL